MMKIGERYTVWELMAGRDLGERMGGSRGGDG